MKTYEVTVTDKIVTKYFVEAESWDDAKDIIESAAVDELRDDFKHEVLDSYWNVDEITPDEEEE